MTRGFVLAAVRGVDAVDIACALSALDGGAFGGAADGLRGGVSAAVNVMFVSA